MSRNTIVITTEKGTGIQVERIPEINIEWQEMWQEIQMWYGDIKKAETEKQFLIRMHRRYSLEKKKRPAEPDYDDWPEGIMKPDWLAEEERAKRNQKIRNI